MDQVIKPMKLKSARAIGEHLGVDRNTIRIWKRKYPNCPIHRTPGGRYWAYISELDAWQNEELFGTETLEC